MEATEQQVQSMYAPVLGGLERVAGNLQRIAAEAGRLPDPSLLAHAVSTGGKKVRPALTLLAAQFHAHEGDAVVTMATAVELLHIATLIHDDMVDKAALRRGRVTVSSQWGPDVAVLLGDYVFAVSATYVCDTGNIRVVRRFSETIMELASGQMAERFNSFNWDGTVADYSHRIYNKTASLFCTAAESGAVLSGAPEPVSQALKTFGRNIGMAFQVMDDVLDFQGTEEELGKPVGNDLLQGTLTLPALLYVESHPDDAALGRLRAGSRSPEDMQTLVNNVRASSAPADALRVMEGYREEARRSLAGLPSGRARDSLNALADYVTHRRT